MGMSVGVLGGSLGVSCVTSLGGGFVSEEPPMMASHCFTSNVRFTPGASPPAQGFLISLSNVSLLPSSPCMLTVSCL